MEILKIASQSNPNLVAGAIAGLLKENGFVELNAVGAGAVNQAVKSIVIARGYVATAGIDLICIPAFTEVDIAGVDKTAIKFILKGGN